MTTEQSLRPGQRYTFYEKRSSLLTETTCRCMFLEIREIINSNGKSYKYLYTKRGNGPQNIVTISPYEWVTKIETLDDMITSLPSDVVNLIDEYI